MNKSKKGGKGSKVGKGSKGDKVAKPSHPLITGQFTHDPGFIALIRVLETVRYGGYNHEELTNWSGTGKVFIHPLCVMPRSGLNKLLKDPRVTLGFKKTYKIESADYIVIPSVSNRLFSARDFVYNLQTGEYVARLYGDSIEDHPGHIEAVYVKSTYASFDVGLLIRAYNSGAKFIMEDVITQLIFDTLDEFKQVPTAIELDSLSSLLESDDEKNWELAIMLMGNFKYEDLYYFILIDLYAKTDRFRFLSKLTLLDEKLFIHNPKVCNIINNHRLRYSLDSVYSIARFRALLIKTGLYKGDEAFYQDVIVDIKVPEDEEIVVTIEAARALDRFLNEQSVLMTNTEKLERLILKGYIGYSFK